MGSWPCSLALPSCEQPEVAWKSIDEFLGLEKHWARQGNRDHLTWEVHERGFEVGGVERLGRRR